jgi:methylmalonyl-CoA mutase N-terminal domain/subunit
MALSCFDEAIAIPTTHAQTLALRTQQVLQHEFGLTDVADPLGGSWYVGQLTDRLEADARALMAEIDRMGGAVAAIERGFYQQLIADEAYAKEQRIASGEDVVVGVNAFVDDSAPAPERFDVPPELERESREKLERLRSERDAQVVDARLAELAEVARGSGDLMPPLLEAVRADATVGEICGALRGVFGEYRPAVAMQI